MSFDRYIASVSFGKDSLAMVLLILERGLPLDEVVFYDTGMEFKAIYDTRDRVLPILYDHGVKYTELRPPRPFLFDMLEKPVSSKKNGLHYGYSWCGGCARWGTANKTSALDKHAKAAGKNVIQYIGIAADEQKRLQRLPLYKVAPLAKFGFTEADALAYDQVIYIGTRKHTITHAELWWTGGVKYFKTDAFAGTIAGDFIVDTEHGDETNDYTEPHFTVGNKAYNWDTVPIVWLKYNEEELPLCYFIKDLIDDINWQTSVTADVLRDVAKFIYILKNYGGQDLGEFIKDLKEHMAIKVTTDGGVDKLQADLNIDAVMAFLDKQRRDVYDFAAAVDTKDPDLGNASGTAINFRYMDLSSDCDSLATELKDTFQRLKLFIDVYLQIAGKGDFSKETFDIVFNMDLPVNETDVIQNAVASESLLSKRTILQNHPWVTDADEEMERIDAEKKAAMEEYGEGLFGDALGAGKGQNGQGDPVNGGGADGNE